MNDFTKRPSLDDVLDAVESNDFDSDANNRQPTEKSSKVAKPKAAKPKQEKVDGDKKKYEWMVETPIKHKSSYEIPMQVRILAHYLGDTLPGINYSKILRTGVINEVEKLAKEAGLPLPANWKDLKK